MEEFSKIVSHIIKILYRRFSLTPCIDEMFGQPAQFFWSNFKGDSGNTLTLIFCSTRALEHFTTIYLRTDIVGWTRGSLGIKHCSAGKIHCYNYNHRYKRLYIKKVKYPLELDWETKPFTCSRILFIPFQCLNHVPFLRRKKQQQPNIIM